MEVLAEPKAIPRVREEVKAHAERLGVSARGVADLKTVVSEACSNIVRYAYEDDEAGPMEVELLRRGDVVRVLIRDRGCGITPRPDADLPSLHMGLPIIGALSSRFVLSSERGTGTELLIEVPVDAAAAV